MDCAADFARVLAQFLECPLECMGKPAATLDVSWELALELSAPFFNSVGTRIDELLSAKTRPILVTSRCATSIATLPVVSRDYSDVILLWLDAHGDLNTPETSPSGYLGGMPLAAGLGVWDSGYGSGLSGDRVIHVGGRDLDESELELIKSSGIVPLTMNSPAADLQQLALLTRGKQVYVHIDTDVYEPSEVVAEYAVSHGLTRGDVAAIVDTVMRAGMLVGLEITELSPRNDAQKVASYQALLDSLAPLRA